MVPAFIVKQFKPLILVAALFVAACDSPEERAAEHFARATGFLEADDKAKAIVEFRNVLQIEETHVDARYQLALLLKERNRVRPAIRNFLRLIDLQPDHLGGRVELAALLLDTRQVDAALKHSEAAYKLAPDDVRVLSQRATVALLLGNYELAEKLALRAIEIDPFSPSAGLVLTAHRIRTEDLDGALEVVDRFIGYDPSVIDLHLAKLQILQSRNEMNRIGEQLILMVEKFPEVAGFRRALVQWRASQGDVEGVERDLRSLVDIVPDEVAPVLDLVRHVIRHRGQDAGRDELVAQIAKGRNTFALQTALAQMDYRSGRQDEAKALIQSVIDAGGEDVNAARLIMARFLVTETQRAAALVEIEAVLEADEKNADALLMRAALKIDDDRVDDAILDLRSALEESPRNVNALLLIASAYERNGSRELASERYAAAMQASDYDETAAIRYSDFLARTGQADAMEIVLTEAARRQPNSALILRRLADIRLRLQKWVEAEDAARRLRALEANPGFADRVLVTALSGQERYGESLSVLDEMSRASGSENASMTGIVGVYLKSGDVEAAEEFIANILEANPDNPQALVLKAVMHAREGDSAAAEETLQRVTEVAPDIETGYRVLANLYSRLGRSEETLETLQRGVDAVENADGLRLLMAMEHERRQDYDNAIARYRELIEANPNSLVVVNNLASLLSDHYADQPDQVAFAAEIAEPLRSSNLPNFQDTYGWLKYLNGEYEDALRSLLPAVEGLPNNPWVQFHAGMTYAALKQTEEARLHLERALELGGAAFPQRTTITETLQSLPATADQ